MLRWEIGKAKEFYFDSPIYWGGIQSLGFGTQTGGAFIPNPLVVNDKENLMEHTLDEKVWNPHLRSTLNVIIEGKA